MRILVADAHHLFREGLIHVLKEAPEIIVVGSASNGDTTLRQAMALQPDLILIDPGMPDANSLDVLQKLMHDLPRCKTLVLAVSAQRDDLLAALRAGVRGYLLKSTTSHELIDAIYNVQAGGVVLGPDQAASLVDEFLRLSSLFVQAGDEHLSRREREVLQFIGQGLSNKETAAQMGLSPHTVKSHLRSLMEKLKLHRRSEVAAWAVRHGYVQESRDR
jgi:DNA-binding NarL/FixJ family response regulator